jgi:hypothetical protein
MTGYGAGLRCSGWKDGQEFQLQSCAVALPDQTSTTHHRCAFLASCSIHRKRDWELQTIIAAEDAIERLSKCNNGKLLS